MAKRQVFYSFHFDNDVMRVQQVRNMGVIEGNVPVSANDWETVKRRGDSAIKTWIDEAMNYRSTVIVLVGSQTAKRPWVRHEIEKAWNEQKAVLGIYVHNLKCPRQGYDSKGTNPFESINLKNGKKLSEIVLCHNPDPKDAYSDIKNNLELWIEYAHSHKRQ